jgi:protein-disulfide isomerase-like protein with CxxC motif
MNFLRSILYGLWRVLDGLRRFLHLVVLLVVFGFIVGALRGSMPSVPAKVALLVAPEGQLVEQSTGDPFERAFQEARDPWRRQRQTGAGAGARSREIRGRGPADPRRVSAGDS